MVHRTCVVLSYVYRDVFEERAAEAEAVGNCRSHKLLQDEDLWGGSHGSGQVGWLKFNQDIARGHYCARWGNWSCCSIRVEDSWEEWTANTRLHTWNNSSAELFLIHWATNTTPDKIRKLEMLKWRGKAADLTHPLFRGLERPDVSEVLSQFDLLMHEHCQSSTDK